MSKCPHQNIINCPLNHASHTGLGGGCDDGRCDEGGCAVDRGKSYGKLLTEAARGDPIGILSMLFVEQANSALARKRKMEGLN